MSEQAREKNYKTDELPEKDSLNSVQFEGNYICF
jgi:hypothetical protein